MIYSLTTVIKPLVARNKVVRLFDLISGFHRDTNSFHFPFLSFTRKYLCVAMPFRHSSMCKRNTLQPSTNKIISHHFLRKCLFAGDSCLYVSAALAFDNNASAVRPY